MLSQQDLNQLAAKGISEEKLNSQLEEFKTGFPFLKLEAAASVGKGIIAPTEADVKQYEEAWEQYKAQGHSIVKLSRNGCWGTSTTTGISDVRPSSWWTISCSKSS